jgi:hypothetical protein
MRLRHRLFCLCPRWLSYHSWLILCYFTRQEQPKRLIAYLLRGNIFIYHIRPCLSFLAWWVLHFRNILPGWTS